jgi:mRNA-degrading endonuclease RelE of RelBE toxin-antitoxin system
MVFMVPIIFLTYLIKKNNKQTKKLIKKKRKLIKNKSMENTNNIISLETAVFLGDNDDEFPIMIGKQNN